MRRFQESTFDDYIRSLEDSDLDNGSTSGLQHSTLQKPLLLTLHAVNIEETSPTTPVTLYSLPELSSRFFERTLVPLSSATHARWARIGLTMRITRTDHGLHVFSGKPGDQPRTLSAVDETTMLNQAPFHRMGIFTQHDHERSNARLWRFTTGEPSINQWLAGMGQTEQYEPDESSEMPRETEKLLIAEKQRTVGRVRVPKGVSVLPTDSDNEQEEKAAERVAAGSAMNSFHRLLHGKGAVATESEGSDDEWHSADSTPDDAPSKRTFAALLHSKPPAQARTSSFHDVSNDVRPSSARTEEGVDKKATSKTSSDLVSQTVGRTATAHAKPAGSNVHHSSTASEIPEHRSSSDGPSQTDSFISHGQQFAAVDKIGLTADAGAQAKWELGHGNPRGGNDPRFPVPSSMTGTTASSGGGPSSIPASATASRATIRSYAETPPITEPWANKVVRDDYIPNNPVNDSTSRIHSTIKVHPRFLQQKNRSPPRASSNQQPLRATVANKLPQQENMSPLPANGSQQPPQATVPDDLIDFSEPERTNPMRRPLQPSWSQSTVHAEPTPPADQTEDEIVERLQVDLQDPLARYYTMRQKAGKGKKKSGNQKKNTSKVELPIPEPPPPPRVPQKTGSKQATTLDTSSSSKPKAADVSSGSSRPAALSAREDAGDAGGAKSASEDAPQLDIEKLLHLARHTPQCTVRIDIGLILLKPLDEKALRKAPLTLQQAQTKVSAECAVSGTTSFISRLTSSPSDAHHILGLLQGAASTVAAYTFEVRDQNGRLHEVRIPSGAPDQVQSRCTDGLAELFTHYPLRVWDAKAVVTSTAWTADQALASEKLQQFASSLCSVDDEAPPTVAFHSPDGFAVETVFAKREYTRSIDVGRLVVTEVQELFLSAIPDPKGPLGNFAVTKAVGTLRDEMVEHQRYWWEACVHVDDPDASAADVNAVVDGLVTRMDGVGCNNRGPLRRRDELEQRVARGAKTARVAPVIPFW